jgi:hypothetical protein
VDEQKSMEVMPAVTIRYVGIGQLTVFLVSEDELRLLESGGAASTCLNLGIAFSSIGFGSLIALMLSNPSESLYKFTVVVVITVLSIISGFVLLAIWHRLRKHTSETISRIRLRAVSAAGGTVLETGDQGNS